MGTSEPGEGVLGSRHRPAHRRAPRETETLRGGQGSCQPGQLHKGSLACWGSRDGAGVFLPQVPALYLGRRKEEAGIS